MPHAAFGCVTMLPQEAPMSLQGYLAHKKPPPPLGPPYGRRHRATVRSYGESVSYERGTPVERTRHIQDSQGQILGLA